jgi:hypothetical protein
MSFAVVGNGEDERKVVQSAGSRVQERRRNPT